MFTNVIEKLFSFLVEIVKKKHGQNFSFFLARITKTDYTTSELISEYV